MKAAALLCLFAVCVHSSTADIAEELAAVFQTNLNNVLKEASGQWEDDLTLNDLSATLVKESTGWLSFQEGHVYNLSEWSRSGDATIKCVDDGATLTIGIGYNPLWVSSYYLYDNGTELYPSSSLSATVSKLAASLVIYVDLNKTTASVSNFEFITKDVVAEPRGEMQYVSNDDVGKALAKSLGSGILSTLQSHLVKVISESLVQHKDWDVVSQACVTTTTTTPKSTATTPKPTTTTPKSTATTPKPTTTTPKPTTTTTKPNATTTKPNTATTKPNTATTKPNTATTKPTTKKAAATKQTPRAGSQSNRNNKEIQDREDKPVDQTTKLNTLVDVLLTNTTAKFADHNLGRFRLPDSNEEIYKAGSEDGTATLEVKLLGLRSLTISELPEVMVMNKTAMVTANVNFHNLMYTAQLKAESAGSTWNLEGNSLLTGQLFVDVDWENSSAATVAFQRFQLWPFVTLEGNASSQAKTLKAAVDQNEVVDALKGVFKDTVVPELNNVTSPAIKTAALHQTWDVTGALTTTLPPQTTTHSSASMLTPLRTWTATLVFLFAVKLLL